MKRKAKILVVDDEAIMRESLQDWLSDQGHVVFTTGNAGNALQVIAREKPDIAIIDLVLPGTDGLEVLKKARQSLPDIQVIIITAFGSVPTAITAIREGACDYLEKPFCPERVETLIDRVMEMKALSEENLSLWRRLEDKYSFENIIARGSRMRKVIEVIQVVARSNTPVFISGESGTGKELVARAIHSQSYRKGKPFIAVNCASVPESVLEVDLFGYEKGALAGAQKTRRGKFEAANKGTLFLDEIADLSPNTQVRLLRVLEEREFSHQGGNQMIPVDVRFISATDKDTGKGVTAGEFREDLYYRLNVVSIELPPLRERREDIVLLAEHFLRRFSEENQKKISGFSSDTLDFLLKYEWPGNIRELENAVERAVILSRGSYIETTDLSIQNLFAPRLMPQGKTMQEIEKSHILNILVECNGNYSEAARLLGISRMTLYNKIKAYDLSLGKLEKSRKYDQGEGPGKRKCRSKGDWS